MLTWTGARPVALYHYYQTLTHATVSETAKGPAIDPEPK
jgi:hypothetical protein